QLLTESLLLAAVGGLCGVGVAFAADKILLAAFVPTDLPGMKISAIPDVRVLLFTLVLTAITGLFFGLVPPLRATKPAVAPVLKNEAGAVVGGGNVRLRKALVVSQVMFSLLLLVGAGLFWKSLSNLENLGPGFPVERLIAFDLNGGSAYTTAAAKLFLERM